MFPGSLMAGECCGDSFCDCQSLSQHNCDQNEVFCTLLDSCVDLFGQSCEDLGWCCGEWFNLNDFMTKITLVVETYLEKNLQNLILLSSLW